MTFTFVVIPWMVTLAYAGAIYSEDAWEGDLKARLMILAAVFNIFPAALLSQPRMHDREVILLERETRNAVLTSTVALRWPSVPHLSFQLFVAQWNRLDLSLIVSILSSFYSIAQLTNNGFWTVIEVITNSRKSVRWSAVPVAPMSVYDCTI